MHVRIMLIFLILLFPLSTHAATLALSLSPHIAVRIERVALSWSWAREAGVQARSFLLKCGPVRGQYVQKVPVTVSTQRVVPLTSVITAPGQYFCVVTAHGPWSESAPSKEIEFTVIPLDE